PGEPGYRATGLVDGAYTVALDPASVPGVMALLDRDGGDHTLTHVTLAGTDLDDVDFAVFRNDPPTATDQTASAVCGIGLVVDPLSGVTDPNGGPLALVPGSVHVPDGV